MNRPCPHTENRLLENNPDVLWATDRHLKFTFVSPGIRQLTGHTASEILGRPIHKLVTPASARLINAELKKLLAGRKPAGQEKKRLELEFVHRDGSRVWGETTVIKLAWQSGLPAGFSGIIRDIDRWKRKESKLTRHRDDLKQFVEESTADIWSINAKLQREIEGHKKLEKALQESMEAAEAANVAKSEFLANMSHEIRTPMNGIIGMCDLVMETELDQKQQEFLEIIHASGKSLLELINDILDLSKIEAGKLELENIPFSLPRVVEEVSGIFLNKITEKDLELILDIPEDLPETLVADPLRIRQVLINLLSNAIKFTEKGSISISVRQENSGPDAVQLSFRVRDSGIGIPHDIKEHLFDAFTQADGTVTRKYGGSGLGLAICKRIVNMMSGDIRVESEVGLGSSFFFTAPFQIDRTQSSRAVFGGDADRSAPPPGEADYLDAFADVSILLVEDNPINQRVATEMLSGAGIRVDVADNGLSALAHIKKKSYDAVLMDVQMPEMDGIETTRIIRNELNMQQLPIIALTAHTMAGDRDRCLEAGMNDHLPKPIDRASLFKSLKHHIGVMGGRFDALSGACGPATAPAPAFGTEIPGLDVTAGMTRLGDDWNLYVDVVREYCEYYRDFSPEIKQLIAKKEFATARRKAHGLKGAAANLSAGNLSTVAYRLEMACADENARQAFRLLPEIEVSLAEVFTAYETLASNLLNSKN